MKLAILAASIAIGVASLAGAAQAQDGQTVSRMPADTGNSSSVPVGRTVAPGATAPALESMRPAAGMLPAQPSVAVRSYIGTSSSEPPVSSDLRELRRD